MGSLKQLFGSGSIARKGLRAGSDPWAGGGAAPATPRPYLILSGTGGEYIDFLNVGGGGYMTFVSGDYLQFDWRLDDGGTANMFVLDGGANYMALNGTTKNIDYGSLSATLTIDGTPYANGSSMAAFIGDGLLHRFRLEFTGAETLWRVSLANPVYGVVANIEGTESTVAFAVAIDSESTTTETLDVGTGSVSFGNVIAGDWQTLALELAPQA